MSFPDFQNVFRRYHINETLEKITISVRQHTTTKTIKLAGLIGLGTASLSLALSFLGTKTILPIVMGLAITGIVIMIVSIALLALDYFYNNEVAKQPPCHSTHSTSSTSPKTTSSAPKDSSSSSIQSFEDPLSKRLRRFNDSNCHGSICGAYITTNELGLEEVMSFLMKTSRVVEGFHIGFSGWYNFDVMAARRSGRGLICDFNPDNKKFIERTLQILRTSSSRESFVKAMMEFAEGRNGIYFSPNDRPECIGAENEIRQELYRKGSWLFTEEAFNHIKNLAMSDKIAAITTDIRNSANFQKVATLFADNNMSIDSLYLSNISMYLSHEVDNRNAYTSTVKLLIKPETIVINASTFQSSRRYAISGSGNWKQEVFLGASIQKPDDYERLFPSKK